MQRQVLRRAFSTSVRANASWQTSTTSNGVKVASLDASLPVASIAFACGSGARHETRENRGVHALASRLAFTGAYENEDAEAQISDFKIGRITEMKGVSIKSVSGREYGYDLLTGLRSEVDTMGELGGKSFALPTYQTWDVQDAAELLAHNNESIAYEQAVLEDAHRGLYKNSLGLNVLPEPYRLKNLNKEALADYLDKNRTTGASYVVGVGVEHSKLVEIAESHLSGLSTGAAPAKAAPAVANRNVLVDCSSPVTHVVFGFDAAGTSPAVVEVLRHALGSSSRVKRGKGASHLHSAVPDGLQFSVNAITSHYSDTSFLGVYVKAYNDDIQKVYDAVKGALQSAASGGLSGEAVARGKAGAKTAALNLTGEALVESGISQLVSGGAPKSPEELAAAYDGVSDSEVSAAAQKILSSGNVTARGDMYKLTV